jgi:hypothetical protein
MAVSFYDVPAQANFIQTYVPQPFEDIAKAGALKQQRYDLNRQALEQQIAEAESLRAIPGSQDEAYVRDVVDTMRSVADEYASQDYGNPEVVRDIARKIRQGGVDRRRLSDIQQSFAGYQDYMKQEAQLKAKNLYAPELSQDFSGYDTYGTGVFAGSPEALQDTEQAFREAFSNIKGDYLREQNLGGGRRASMIGVTEDKLQQHVLDNYERLARDPRISQFIRRAGIDPRDTTAAMQLLLAEAPKYAWEQPEGFYSTDTGSKKSSTLQLPFSTSVLKHLAAEPVDDKYINVKKARGKVDRLGNDIIDLQSRIETADPRQLDQLESQLSNLNEEKQKIENATKWAETEALEKHAGEKIDILSKYGAEALPYDISPDSAFIGDPNLRLELQNLEDRQISYAQGLLDEYGIHHTQEAIRTTPTTRIIKDESGNMYGESWNPSKGTSGGFMTSKFGNIIADIMTDPSIDKNMVRPVGAKDNDLKKFKEAESLYVQGVSSPSDKRGAFVSVAAFKEGRNDKQEKIGEYNIYLNNQTQTQAIAELYLQNNNIQDAGRWYRPDIEQTIQNKTEGGGVDQFNIPITGTDAVTVLNTEEGWIVRTSDGRQSTPKQTRSQLSSYIYDIMFLNQNR